MLSTSGVQGIPPLQPIESILSVRQQPNGEKTDLLFHFVDSLANQLVVRQVGKGHLQARGTLHLAFDSEHRALVAGPAAACDTVVHVPEKHLLDMTRGILRSVDHHTEAAVDYLAPAYAAAVVDRNPGSAAERVADNVLHSHISRTVRTVVDVRGFTVRRIGTRHVVVVTTQYDRCGNFAACDSVVERERDLGAALAVGIQDTCLRTYDQLVLASLLDPVDIVVELSGDLLRSGLANLFEHFGSQTVCSSQVFGFARRTYQRKGPKP